MAAQPRAPRIAIIAFDMFGTLVSNETHEWIATLEAIAHEQRLSTPGAELYRVWSGFEVNFRKTRTRMDDPAASPPFRSYWQAWHDAFVQTFAALGIGADPRLAATRCVEQHVTRRPFADTPAAVAALAARWPLGVCSNADDAMLLPLVAGRGWPFTTVVSSEQARAYKPDPRIFRAFCAAAHVEPAHVLYVGDSAYDDAHGARLAGMQTVLVRRDQRTPGRTPPPETAHLLPADHEIASLAELPTLVDRLSATAPRR